MSGIERLLLGCAVELCFVTYALYVLALITFLRNGVGGWAMVVIGGYPLLLAAVAVLVLNWSVR